MSEIADTFEEEFERALDPRDTVFVSVVALALAERGRSVSPCPNCTHPMFAAYCAVCGQERDSYRRSVWSLITFFVKDLLAFDGRIIRTCWALISWPGELACAFREGRTRRYLPTLRLYVFASLAFFIFLGANNIAILQIAVVGTPVKVTWIDGKAYVPNPAYDNEDPDTQFMPKMVEIAKDKAAQPGGHYEYSTKVYFFQPIGAYHVTLSPEARDRLSKASFEFDDEKGKPIDPEKAKKAARSWIESRVFGGLQRLAANPDALSDDVAVWLPRVLFFLMPLYALLLEIFYIRERKAFFYVDHLVFSLTVHAFGYILLTAAAVAAQFRSSQAIGWCALAIAGVYILIAMRKFYGQNWFWTSVKFVTVSSLYCVFLIPVLSIMILLSFLNV